VQLRLDNYICLCLQVSQDQFDCIDLSDNEIAHLENFPLLHRLRILLLNNNKIGKIGSLGASLPNLDTLILTNNKINNLSDIDPLAELHSLQRLSLLDNIVTKKQHYRLYVIHILPKLKVLDFRKVKQKVS
jgi:U2 small nuclear ribonucleoprotein A'